MSEYKANSNTQITQHFNSKEFVCKCGQNHNIKINDSLCLKLEELYSYLKCSKIIISSGFRCPAHSIKVGGYATDEHTKGNAADIICYDKNNKIIDTRTVCCAAQEIDFSGIGRIDYSAVHVDVSASRKWYGDELTGYVSQSIPHMDFMIILGFKNHIAKKSKSPLKLTITSTVDYLKKRGDKMPCGSRKPKPRKPR